MPSHTIDINDGPSYRCSDTHTLLEGMESLGKKGIPVGCRGGGCGVCKVHIVSGSYSKRVMSRDHVSVEEEALGCVLACRVKPTSDISLHVIGKMKKNVYRVVEPTSALFLST
ncbi:MAG: ferredoxin [Comamonadaceae bacterium CG1_02_60_18]|nr:MAG: ferredoxin [Comamonadaceae bacterium CG1_02_60_18]PIQ54953.1 MAG: ferredoxin [Comamonadaceae bacterium CG12_big_fil_rev_8_21_14_0_65_59_15]